MIRSLIAASLSLTILALSPGLPCYEALAALSRGADVRAGRSAAAPGAGAVLPAQLRPPGGVEAPAGSGALTEPIAPDAAMDLAPTPMPGSDASLTRAAPGFLESRSAPGTAAGELPEERARLKELGVGARGLARAETQAARRGVLGRMFDGGRKARAAFDEPRASRIGVSFVEGPGNAPALSRAERPGVPAKEFVPAVAARNVERGPAFHAVPAALAVAAGALAGLFILPGLAAWIGHAGPQSASWTTAGAGIAALGAVAAGRGGGGSAGAGYQRGKEKPDLRSFPIGRIFKILAPYKRIMATATVVMTLQALIQLILPKLFSQMTELLIGKAATSPLYDWLLPYVASSPWPGALWGLLPADPWTASLAIIFACALAAGGVLFWLMKRVSFLMTYIGSVQMRDLSETFYEHILHLPLSLFQKHRDGELTAVLDTNLYDFRLGATQLVTDSIKQLVLFGLTCLFMFQVHWKVAVVSIVVFAAALGGPSELFRRARSAVYEDFYASKRRLTGESQEKIGNIRVAKAFGQEGAEAAKYRAIAEDVFMDKGMRIARVSALQFATDEILTWLALFVVAAAGGYYVHVGELAVGDFSSLVIYAFFLKNAFGGLTKNYKSLGDTQGAARLVFELWDRLTERYNDDRPKTGRVRGEIEIRNLHFAYTQPAEGAGREELVDGTLVMDGINLHIPAGTSLAVVGKSGSGKTTLSDLIMRFLSPTPMAWVAGADGSRRLMPLLAAEALKEELGGKEKILIEPQAAGTILVDGQDISGLNLVGYRNQFGLVPQEPAIFSGSVKSNIVYGLPDATLERIERAARQAHAYDFIRELDAKTGSFAKGLETIVGQRGARLSTGQKQRLMIARAFLVDPPILIMDEPTASLDAESEEAVVKAMENVMAGRTTIVVAHRLSTIRRAQKVVFLEKGRIAEEGTIDELLKIENGKFRAYWETQALKEKLEERER